MNKDIINFAKSAYVAFIAVGWMLTSFAYLKEVRARKAAEARYAYDFEGILEIGKTPPRVTRYSTAARDSLWVIDPKRMFEDSAWLFQWKDSSWHWVVRPEDELDRVHSMKKRFADLGLLN